MIIIVAGFAGSGKSTLSDLLGKHFNLKVIHASHVMKQLVEGKIDLNNTIGQTGFWESSKAKKIMMKRNASDELDKKLDEILLKEIDKDNVVLDSWTMPWLSEKGIKIWLNASPEIRAKRVMKRDSIKYKDVLSKIIERDEKTKLIYKRIYNFNLGEDLTPFHIIINTNKLNEKQVFDETIKKINELKKLKEVNENGEN
jgi:CMP/dCMP kinase